MEENISPLNVSYVSEKETICCHPTPNYFKITTLEDLEIGFGVFQVVGK
jgi:hypothetical protein